MRYLLIVNPASGGGRALPKLEKVLRFFARKGDQVRVLRTSGPGEAARLVQEHRDEGLDAVIAAGGDGTIHEVLGALAGTGLRLGILPWGTGNVFAREMGLPRRVKALCRVIRQGRSAALDVGRADGRPFLLMAGVGLDAFALQQLEGTPHKRLWGLWAYVGAAFAAWARYPGRPVEVRLDDGRQDRGPFVVVSNTRLYGAFFSFHPEADPTDGQLDVFVFRDPGRWAFLGMAFRLAWHNTLHRRSRRQAPFLARHGVYRCAGLTVAQGRERPVQLDGDWLVGGAQRVDCQPQALQVLLPRKTLRTLGQG